MSMITKEISDFRAYAFHENDFKFVSYVPRNWRIWQSSMNSFEPSAVRFIPSLPTPILSTKHGMTRLTASRRSIIPCWQTPPMRSPKILRC